MVRNSDRAGGVRIRRTRRLALACWRSRWPGSSPRPMRNRRQALPGHLDQARPMLHPQNEPWWGSR